jgi:hypothetical protein
MLQFMDHQVLGQYHLDKVGRNYGQFNEKIPTKKKKDLINAMEGNVWPKIKEKLEMEEDGAGHCSPSYAGDGSFEVDCKGRKFVVNLPSKMCGCRKWDITGIPCAYAISSIWLGGGNPEDYLSPYFDKEMYLKAYASIIYPVPSEEQWVRTDQPT